eukprot:gb/GEZN01001046.1/.p1 GENE.gb/GEZN01001046.1/~~gb/GEZN01001046.1/.p1  ORF type:complete len:1103 (+),score=150.28 gb/GEZN01001046.1/:199-3309(+)
MSGFDYVVLGDSPVRSSEQQRLHGLTPKKITGVVFLLACLYGALEGVVLVLQHNAPSDRGSTLAAFLSSSSLPSLLPATLPPPLLRIPLFSTEQPASTRPETSFSAATRAAGTGAVSVLALPPAGYTALSHYFARQVQWVKLQAAASSLRDADQRALQVPSLVIQSGINATAAWLAAGLESETLKTRAVFSFIVQHVTYDDERARLIDSGGYTVHLSRGETRSQKLSREAFQTKKAVCGGISYLLNEMLASIGIRSRYVSGLSKAAGYVVGDDMPDKDSHAWNLVYLEGGWHLMDATWSLQEKNASNTLTPDGTEQIDYAYWDADPRVLMFSHFPSKPADSLMEQSMTRVEFISTVQLGPMFMLLRNNQQGHLPANNTLVFEGSPLVLRLLVPDGWVVKPRLYSDLEMRRDQHSHVEEEFAVTALRAADPSPASGSVAFVPFDVVISPRRPGIFFCHVLAEKRRGGFLRELLTYKVDATKVPLQGHPAVADIFEPYSSESLGILSAQASAHSGAVVVPGCVRMDAEGSAEIVLPGAERSRMMAEVKVSGKLVEHFAFVAIQDKHFHVQVRSPVIGNAVRAEVQLYTSSIGAVDEIVYRLALSYEIDAAAVRSVPSRFPNIQDTFFRDLCCPVGSSYLNGVIRSDSSGYAFLSLGGADKSKISITLIDLGSKSEVEDFTIVQKHQNLFWIHVRAPRAHSKLEIRIFSLPTGDPALVMPFSIAYEIDASHVAQPLGRFAQVTPFFFQRGLMPSTDNLSSIEGVLKINSMGLGTLTLGGGLSVDLLVIIVNGEEEIKHCAVSERRGDVHHVFVRLGAAHATETNPLSLRIFSRLRLASLRNTDSFDFTAAYVISFASTAYAPPLFPDFAFPLTVGSVLDKVVMVAANHHVLFPFAAPADCAVADIEVVLTHLSGQKPIADVRTRVSKEQHPLSLAGGSARHGEILMVDIGPIPPSMSGARLLATIHRITRREATQNWFLIVAEYEVQVLQVGSTPVAPTTTVSLLPLQEVDTRTSVSDGLARRAEESVLQTGPSKRQKV